MNSKTLKAALFLTLTFPILTIKNSPAKYSGIYSRLAECIYLSSRENEAKRILEDIRTGIQDRIPKGVFNNINTISRETLISLIFTYGTKEEKGAIDQYLGDLSQNSINPCH